MNGRKIADRFGGIDGRYIAEALETINLDGERSKITMKNRKKLLTALIAAALAVAVSVTAVAANSGGLIKLGEYFDKNESNFGTPEEMPKADLLDIGKELTTASPEPSPAETTAAEEKPAEPEPFEPGDARVTSVVATNNGLFCTIEVNVAGYGLPDDGEEHDYGFESTLVYKEVDGERSPFPLGGHINYQRNGDIIEVIISGEDTARPEGKLIFELTDLYYTILEDVNDADLSEYGDEADYIKSLVSMIETEVPAYEGKFEAVLNPEDYTVTESLWSENTAEINGLTYRLELSPNSITFAFDGDRDPELTLEYYEARNEAFDELAHKDITLVTKSGERFTDNLYDYYGDNKFIGGFSGGHISFVTLIDPNEIASVIIGDTEFTF